jgi:CBS domain containing-hemolysin-like protein
MGGCLDQLLGHGEDEQLNRDELTALMHITRISSIENASSNLLDGKVNKEILSADEVNQIQGVLGLSKKSIKDIMIDMDKVFILSSRTVLDISTIQKIDDNGHSRIPICQHEDSNHILGYLLVKKLITVNPEKEVLMSSLELVKPIIVR